MRQTIAKATIDRNGQIEKTGRTAGKIGSRDDGKQPARKAMISGDNAWGVPTSPRQRIDELVDIFAAEVIAQDNAPSATIGNRHAKKCLAAFVELTEIGDVGREALCRLFHHTDPGVRCRAAAFLLRYKHKEAIEVLRQLAAGRGLVAFAAQMSIKNWHTGDWELDLPEDEMQRRREAERLGQPYPKLRPREE